MRLSWGGVLQGTHGNLGIAFMLRPAETRYNLGCGQAEGFLPPRSSHCAPES